MTVFEKARQIEAALHPTGSTEVDVDRLATLCMSGIPDESNLRPQVWKLLLGYVPLDTARAPSVLHDKRQTYYKFVEDLLVEPWKEAQEIINPDHPLSDASDSKWNSYFRDNQTLEQLDKDVRRTLPDIAFFQTRIKSNELSPLSPAGGGDDAAARASLLEAAMLPHSSSSSSAAAVQRVVSRRAIFRRIQHLNREFGARDRAEMLEADDDNAVDDYHWEALERVLFVFAKLNPGIGYVQGMNEILAPLYYVIANDTDPQAQAHAEADSFWCFTQLMSGTRDLYERTLDHDVQRGTDALLRRFLNRLGSYDAPVKQILVSHDIEPAYFAFRWFTCLLSQEFALPDLIRLWDSSFSDAAFRHWTKAKATRRDEAIGFDMEYYIDFCCAMVIKQRECIAQGTFASIIKLLQQYPECDIEDLIQLTHNLQTRQYVAEPLRAKSTNDESSASMDSRESSISSASGSLRSRYFNAPSRGFSDLLNLAAPASRNEQSSTTSSRDFMKDVGHAREQLTQAFARSSIVFNRFASSVHESVQSQINRASEASREVHRNGESHEKATEMPVTGR